MLETVHPTRTWCTFDSERDELTTVQDGYDGISVVTMPAKDVRKAVPLTRLIRLFIGDKLH